MANGISGNRAIAALKVGSTWGTAVSTGTGHRLVGAELNWSDNPQEINQRTVGSGVYAKQSSDFGANIPTIGVAMEQGYRNLTDVILANIFGIDTTSGTPVTTSKNDYLHTLTLETDWSNRKPLTVAQKLDDTESRECPSAFVQTVTLSGTAPGYGQLQATLLGSSIDYSASGAGITNTNTVLDATTAPEDPFELAKVKTTDTFKINLKSGGAVTSATAYGIIDYSVTYTLPMKIEPEINGTSGFGRPVPDGDFSWQLSLTLKEFNSTSFNWLSAYKAGTEFKAAMDLQGSITSSGATNREIQLLFPRLKMVKDPVINHTAAGTNRVQLVFEGMDAGTSLPTGMTNRYAYIKIVNTLSTAFTA